MRIYHVFHEDHSNHPKIKVDYSKYVRSFEIARKIIREETGGSAIMLDHQKCPTWYFTMSWEIKAIDFDNTKDGVLELLNEQAFRIPHSEYFRVPPTSVTPIEDQEALEDARLLADDVDRLSTENSNLRKRIQELEERAEDLRKTRQERGKSSDCPTVSPCIQYDNFPAEKTGKCLHCFKTVGYVGGMPRVNPPASIRD